MSPTEVRTPVEGRALPLTEVPDPVFSAGMVGHGAAVEPPARVVDALAPVSGKILKLLPHAYVVVTPDGVGILVHLGIDTVRLDGAGFTTHVAQGDEVSAGDTVITYDVPAVVAAGFNPVVPVVVMDERDPARIAVAPPVVAGDSIGSGATLFTCGTTGGA